MKEFLSALLFQEGRPLMYHSVLFFILFAGFFLLYAFTTKKIALRNFLLLIFSLYFYYKLSGIFVLLLIVIGSSDYFIGRAIAATKKEKIKTLYLFLAIAIDLGSLSFFKYTNFALDSWFGIIENRPSPLVLNILMPIGISYYIFKTLSYIFDLKREMIEVPEKNYINYLLYVSFFPNILAGPISKARDLLPQFKEKITLTNEHFGKAFFLIIVGAFKKIVIADYLAANFVDRVFDAPRFFTGFDALMASYGATMQLYFDFSGYTDIVIGLALLLGFKIEANFNKPFLAQNISEFWRRWHITLSNWLNEYVFVPLSFSLKSLKRVGVLSAVLITFFISGVWHGAAWTFILWGSLHGVAIAWDVISQKPRKKLAKIIPKWIYSFISIFITFHFLSLSIVLFNAHSLQDARVIYEMIFTDLDFGLATQWISLYAMPFTVLILALVLHYTPMKWYEKTRRMFIKTPWILKILIIVVSFILIYQVFSTDAHPFIYLEF